MGFITASTRSPFQFLKAPCVGHLPFISAVRPLHPFLGLRNSAVYCVLDIKALFLP